MQKQRKDLNSLFKDAHKAPIKQSTNFLYNFVFKQECANLVNSPGTITSQLDSDCVYSGLRKSTFTEAFLGFIETGHRGIAYSEEPLTLTNAMNGLKGSLAAEARQGRLTALESTK